MEILPATLQQWKTSAQRLSLLDASIHNYQGGSGSKMEEKQFILLRSLWRSDLKSATFAKHCRTGGWIAKEHMDAAKAYLNGLKSWQKYTESFSTGDFRDKNKEGTFSLVRYYQHLSTLNKTEPGPFQQAKVNFSPRVTRSMARRNLEYAQESPSRQQGRAEPLFPSPKTPTADDIAGDLSALENLSLTAEGRGFFETPLDEVASSPAGEDLAGFFKAVKDEQIVNTALILFLNALTLHKNDLRGEWSLYRKPFTVSRMDQARKTIKAYEARVDGLLTVGNEERIAAIVEVKPHLRKPNNTVYCRIRVQEAAQMAAWISQHPPNSFSSKPSGSGPKTHR